ncbi:UNVERIFIED_ORG: hypothetical protein J2X79_000235 [Arthrobacter globiformis]|nr:hypothetical protein [Arthrobacter globiformis]
MGKQLSKAMKAKIEQHRQAAKAKLRAKARKASAADKQHRDRMEQLQ